MTTDTLRRSQFRHAEFLKTVADCQRNHAKLQAEVARGFNLVAFLIGFNAVVLPYLLSL